MERRAGWKRGTVEAEREREGERVREREGDLLENWYDCAYNSPGIYLMSRRADNL